MSFKSVTVDPTSFDQIYWASKPPEVRALRDIEDEQSRSTAAAGLAIKGFSIDVPIMVWEWDPYKVMQLRISFGYTWVPSALQAPVTIAPGLSAPGTVPYDPNHPPTGSIKVSLNPADYPPFDPVVPVPTPVHSADYVGIDELAGFFAATDVCHAAFLQGKIKDGQEYDLDPRGKFIFHASQSPFAPGHWSLWFTKV